MRYTYIVEPDSRELMVVHRAIGSTRDYKTIELYYYSVKKILTYPIDFNVRVMLDGVDSIGGDRFGINGPIRRKLNSIFLEVRAEYRRAKRKTK